MRLATFTSSGFTRIGVIVDDMVVDLSRAAPELPTDMVALLDAGEAAMDLVRRAAKRWEGAIPLATVRLEAPVLRPRKFLGIGANYRPKSGPTGMAGISDEEMQKIMVFLEDMQAKGNQMWFNKQVTCVNGPFDAMEIPNVSEELIYEVELAFVIGKRCRHVTRQNAPKVIAGYLICNDVTVVDWSRRSPTATLGKSFDTHGPIGPWIVTTDEIGNPHSLGMRSYVNGIERQNGNTADMIFDCFDMVAYLSQVFTLEPGDILTTGTPSPVKEFLKEGDVVRCEIEHIGHIENIVAKEATP